MLRVWIKPESRVLSKPLYTICYPTEIKWANSRERKTMTSSTRIAAISFVFLLSAQWSPHIDGQDSANPNSSAVDAAFADATRAYEKQLKEWEKLQASAAEIREELSALEKESIAMNATEPNIPGFEPREWQTLDKKFRTTATLIETDGVTVRIEKSDGKTVSVEKRILIAVDRIYVDNCLKQLTDAKEKITTWKAERDRLLARRNEKMAQTEATNTPKPTPPDRRVIAEEVERKLRGVEAKADADTPGAFVAKLSFGNVEIRLPSPIVYLLKGSQHYVGNDFCSVKLLRDGKDVFEDHGVLNINGMPVAVEKIPGSDHFTIEPKTRLGNWHTFKAPGSTFIKVQIGEERIWVPFTITQLPYKSGTPASEILKDRGFPTAKATHYTSWPETKVFDGIIYSPSAGERIIAAEHWKYNSLPYAVLAIVDDRLNKVGSYVDK